MSESPALVGIFKFVCGQGSTGTRRPQDQGARTAGPLPDSRPTRIMMMMIVNHGGPGSGCRQTGLDQATLRQEMEDFDGFTFRPKSLASLACPQRPGGGNSDIIVRACPNRETNAAFMAMLPDSLLSQIFRGCVLKCRMLSKDFKKVMTCSGSVDSPLYLRIVKPQDAFVEVANLKFLVQFKHLFVLISSEALNQEIQHVFNGLKGVSGIEIIQELTISEVVRTSCRNIVLIAQKLTDQKFPLPVNEVLNQVLDELDALFDRYDQKEWFLKPVYNFVIRILFHQVYADQLFTKSIILINKCACFTDDQYAGVHSAVPQSRVIPYLANLMRNDRSDLQRQRAWESLLMLTKVSSDEIGVCLISNIARQDLFHMICSGDNLQVQQTIDALQDLVQHGIGCRNSLIKEGVIKSLMILLQNGVKKYQKQVVSIFNHLTNCNDELKAVLASEGVGAVLVGLARVSGTQDGAVRSLARQGLVNLTAGGHAAVLTLLQEGVAELAVDMVWFPPGSDERNAGIKMLLHISRSPGFGGELVAAGVVEAMVAVTRSEPSSPWDCSIRATVSSACPSFCSNNRWSFCKRTAVEVLTHLAVNSEGRSDVFSQLVSEGAVLVFLRASTADFALENNDSARLNAVLALSIVWHHFAHKCMQNMLVVFERYVQIRQCKEPESECQCQEPESEWKAIVSAVCKYGNGVFDRLLDCTEHLTVMKCLFLAADSNSNSP